jgi:hypothetical protein
LGLPEQRSIHFFRIGGNRFHRETNERIRADDKQFKTAFVPKRQLNLRTKGTSRQQLNTRARDFPKLGAILFKSNPSVKSIVSIQYTFREVLGGGWPKTYGVTQSRTGNLPRTPSYGKLKGSYARLRPESRFLGKILPRKRLS